MEEAKCHNERCRSFSLAGGFQNYHGMCIFKKHHEGKHQSKDGFEWLNNPGSSAVAANEEVVRLRNHITELQQRCDDNYTAYVASDKAHEEKIARIAELEKENDFLKCCDNCHKGGGDQCQNCKRSDYERTGPVKDEWEGYYCACCAYCIDVSGDIKCLHIKAPKTQNIKWFKSRFMAPKDCPRNK